MTMLSAALSDRLDALIDALILDGSLEAASLASILVSAKDSVHGGYHVSLSRRVWAANDELGSGPSPPGDGFSVTLGPAHRRPVTAG